jgi:hypothetical protein
MNKAPLAVLAILLSLTATGSAQVSSPGTAGASNAAAASPGGIPPTVPGTGAGMTSPGGINGVPEAPRSPPPGANPNQVPNSGPLLHSTTPAQAPSTMGTGSRNTAGTVGSSAPQKSQKDMDKALDASTDQKIKSICKGC